MTMTNPPQPPATTSTAEQLAELARESLENATTYYRRAVYFSAPCLERARHLLVDLWLAGLTHGVKPADWSLVASMPSNVLDVLRYEAPQAGEAAVPVVDAVLAAVLELRGEGSASRRDLFSIYLHDTSTSFAANPLASYGGTGFVLQLDKSGWSMWIERAANVASRSISIRSGYDDAGIAGAAQVAIDVNEGRRGDSMFQPE